MRPPTTAVSDSTKGWRASRAGHGPRPAPQHVPAAPRSRAASAAGPRRTSSRRLVTSRSTARAGARRCDVGGRVPPLAAFPLRDPPPSLAPLSVQTPRARGPRRSTLPSRTRASPSSLGAPGRVRCRRRGDPVPMRPGPPSREGLPRSGPPSPRPRPACAGPSRRAGQPAPPPRLRPLGRRGLAARAPRHAARRALRGDGPRGPAWRRSGSAARGRSDRRGRPGRRRRSFLDAVTASAR